MYKNGHKWCRIEVQVEDYVGVIIIIVAPLEVTTEPYMPKNVTHGMEQTTAFLSLMIFKSWILNEVEIMYAYLVLYKEYFFLAYFVYTWLYV